MTASKVVRSSAYSRERERGEVESENERGRESKREKQTGRERERKVKLKDIQKFYNFVSIIRIVVFIIAKFFNI